jgi:hypothetical protein
VNFGVVGLARAKLGLVMEAIAAVVAVEGGVPVPCNAEPIPS